MSDFVQKLVGTFPGKFPVGSCPGLSENSAVCRASGVKLPFANKTMQLFKTSACVNVLK